MGSRNGSSFLTRLFLLQRLSFFVDRAFWKFLSTHCIFHFPLVNCVRKFHVIITAGRISFTMDPSRDANNQMTKKSGGFSPVSQRRFSGKQPRKKRPLSPPSQTLAEITPDLMASQQEETVASPAAEDKEADATGSPTETPGTSSDASRPSPKALNKQFYPKLDG